MKYLTTCARLISYLSVYLEQPSWYEMGGKMFLGPRKYKAAERQRALGAPWLRLVSTLTN